MFECEDGSKIYETAKVIGFPKHRFEAVDGCYSLRRTLIQSNPPSVDIHLSRDSFIGDFCFVYSKHLRLEEGSQISPHAIISGGGEVRMGKFSNLGFGAQLITATDSTRGKYMCEAAEDEDRKVIRGSITLGEGVSICANAVICVSAKCPNIVIGKFSVIGAGSYIDKSTPDYTIVYPKQALVTRIRAIRW